MDDRIKYDDIFIGTVKGYDQKTRELEVFIPKLMPAIAENSETLTSITKYNSAKINGIKYNNNIKLASTFTVRARDVNEKLPDIGSKVSIIFLDENLQLGYWFKFNVNDDYKIINDEKYDDLFKLSLGEQDVLIRSQDNVKINLPDYLKPVVLKEGKDITINLIPDEDNVVNKIKQLEETIGKPSSESVSVVNGEVIRTSNESSGLFKRIENLEENGGGSGGSDGMIPGSSYPTVPTTPGLYMIRIAVDSEGEPSYEWTEVLDGYSEASTENSAITSAEYQDLLSRVQALETEIGGGE